jgi:hypothetical protein
VSLSLSSDAHLLLKSRFAAAAISDIEFLLVSLPEFHVLQSFLLPSQIAPLSMHLLHIRNESNPQVFAPQAFALWILLESLMHMLQLLEIEPVKNLLNGCSNGLLKPLLQLLSRFFTTICDMWFARDFRGQEKQ